MRRSDSGPVSSKIIKTSKIAAPRSGLCKDDRYGLCASLVPRLGGDEEASARDVFGTLRKQRGAKAIKKLMFDALTMTTQDGEEGPISRWVVGQKGPAVLGIGDEPYVQGGSAEEAEAQSLSHEEKLKLLISLLEGGATKSQTE
jgi:hypothetical protein